MNSETNSQQSLPKICMLDIETLDIKPTAMILSLGAVSVYPRKGESNSWYQEFTTRYGQYGRTEDADTRKWWEGQDIPMPDGSVQLTEGLRNFHAWYKEHEFAEVWCKGSDFDFVILANAYRSISKDEGSIESLGTPWKYNEVRDLRTLIKCFPSVSNPAPFGNHNALIDAICQALHLRELLSHIDSRNLI